MNKINFKRIRKAAINTGLSTRKIADKAGNITHSTVASVLAGRTNPTATNIKNICDAIGLPIEQAFMKKG